MDGRSAAALENAQWCDLVCRSHGLRTSGDPAVAGGGVWATADRAPAGYPDAVTTSTAATAEAVLADVDTRPGCSVKDSFAALDLAPWGFEVLFEARWIRRDAAAPPPAGAGRAPRASALGPVTSADGLAAWRAAHGGAEALTARLLDEPSVLVLAAEGRGAEGRGAEVLAGAVGHRGGSGAGATDGAVVGVSNVVTAGTDPDRVWADVVLALRAWAPGLPLVGYEREHDLPPALAAGFADVGPLRVWHRPA